MNAVASHNGGLGMRAHASALVIGCHGEVQPLLQEGAISPYGRL